MNKTKIQINPREIGKLNNFILFIKDKLKSGKEIHLISKTDKKIIENLKRLNIEVTSKPTYRLTPTHIVEEEDGSIFIEYGTRIQTGFILKLKK